MYLNKKIYICKIVKGKIVFFSIFDQPFLSVYLHAEQSVVIAMYAKCYIITKGSVSANLFTLKSDMSFSLKNYLHKYTHAQ